MVKNIDDKDLVDVTGGSEDEPLTPRMENDSVAGNTDMIANLQDGAANDNDSDDNQNFHE